MNISKEILDTITIEKAIKLLNRDFNIQVIEDNETFTLSHEDYTYTNWKEEDIRIYSAQLVVYTYFIGTKVSAKELLMEVEEERIKRTEQQ